MKTRVILPPEENQDHTLDMFMGAIERDSNTHLWRLATTLELNKFDAEHQSMDDPIIVPRLYDNFGLVKTLILPPHYRQYIPQINAFMEPIVNKDYGEASRIVFDIKGGDKEKSALLTVMLAVGGIDRLLMDMLTKDEFTIAPPLTEKKYFSNGIPSSYKINERAVSIEAGSMQGDSGWHLSIRRPLYTENSPIFRGK